MNYKESIISLHNVTNASLVDCKRALVRAGWDECMAKEIICSGEMSINNSLSTMHVASSKVNTYPGYPVGQRIPYGNYRFTNVYSVNKVLSFNENATSPAVVLEDRGIGNHSQRQLYSYGTTRQLYPEYTRQQTSYDGYTRLAIKDDNNSVILRSQGNTPVISVLSRDDFAPVVQIKIPSGKYLASNLNGTGVEFTSTFSEHCKWYAERIYRMKGVYGFEKNIEFFSAATMNKVPYSSSEILEDGMIPDSWMTAAEKLYCMLFSDEEFLQANDLQIYGNMYGALYNRSIYDGKFHTGVDINADLHHTIKSPISGVVVYSGGSVGRVTILGDDDLYYTFLHTEDQGRIIQGTYVSVGDIIGQEGFTGLTSQDDHHVHFEISAFNRANQIPLSSFADLDETYYPYDICSSWT